MLTLPIFEGEKTWRSQSGREGKSCKRCFHFTLIYCWGQNGIFPKSMSQQSTRSPRQLWGGGATCWSQCNNSVTTEAGFLGRGWAVRRKLMINVFFVFLYNRSSPDLVCSEGSINSVRNCNTQGKFWSPQMPDFALTHVITRENTETFFA